MKLKKNIKKKDEFFDITEYPFPDAFVALKAMAAFRICARKAKIRNPSMFVHKKLLRDLKNEMYDYQFDKLKKINRMKIRSRLRRRKNITINELMFSMPSLCQEILQLTEL